MEELEQLGPRLRAARQERGWTLEELAHRANMSVSTLSRLESGKRQAGLELLLPLTRQLGIRIDDLLEPRDRDPRVRRTAVRREGMTIAPLTREESEVRAFKITYHPEPASESAPARAAKSRAAPGAGPHSSRDPEPCAPGLKTHEGHEWLYVLSGKLRLMLGEQNLVLGRGEAAEFDTTVPHYMRAEGSKPAEVISIFNAVGERLHLHSAE